jgi:hypothetical protein
MPTRYGNTSIPLAFQVPEELDFRSPREVLKWQAPLVEYYREWTVRAFGVGPWEAG